MRPEKTSIFGASKVFNVPQTTVYDKKQKRMQNELRKTERRKETQLLPSEEDALVTWIRQLVVKRFRVNPDGVRKKAGQMLAARTKHRYTNVSARWELRFRQRHPEISQYYPKSYHISGKATEVQESEVDTSATEEAMNTSEFEDSDGFKLRFSESTSEADKNYFRQKYSRVDKVALEKLHCSTCDAHIGTAPNSEKKLRSHSVLSVTQCNKCFEFYVSLIFWQISQIHIISSSSAFGRVREGRGWI